jgi:hypothetical protein
MGNLRQDATFLDFDFALHTEKLEENFHTGLGR